MHDPLIALLLLAGVFCAYVLPSIIAAMRGHHQLMPIFLLNVLLGWTMLGWVAALIWAFSWVRPHAQR